MHRYFIAVCLTVWLVFAGCSRKPEPASNERVPARTARKDLNVLLITIDTLRADYLSCYGRKSIATPNIDALAARGVRCAQAIAQIPLTAPSHASILTGTYPQVHKVRDMGGFVLDEKVPTLATILGQAGFETAAFVGSAVLGHHYGLNRGFATYGDEMKADQDTKKLPGVVAEVRGEVVTQRTLDWLDKSASKRFFLWVHYYDPHFPYDPPEPYRTRYPKDPYGGEVAYADEQVGRLLKALEQHQLQERTLVVLLADHGESLGEHGEYTHGVFLYDSTVHIPLIFAGPGVPGGRIVPQQVRSIDVLPTVTDYLGLAAGDQAQGASLMPSIIEGKPPRSNDCYLETLYPKTQMGWSELRGMRTDEWKLIVAPKPELYRFSDDRSESRNVVEKFPADADRLKKKVSEVARSSQSLTRIQPQLVNEERRRELNALGYVGGGRRVIQIDMSGPDPKDRVAILGVLEHASEAMNHDRWKDAVPLLEKISRQDPGNPLIYAYLQMCYERLGQFDRMEQACRRAIENKAENDSTYAGLGGIYIRRGNLARAAEFMEKAAQLNPANLENMDNLATAYLQLGRPDDAQRVLQAILVQDARHAGAHNVLGILEVQRSRPEEARRHFEQAIESNPDLAEPYMNLGLLAQKAGQAQIAMNYYREFLKRARPDKHGDYIPKVKEALRELESVR
jgi:arylsulfatase A-like enzyme/Tfp pilus assembly protein PilF